MFPKALIRKSVPEPLTVLEEAVLEMRRSHASAIGRWKRGDGFRGKVLTYYVLEMFKRFMKQEF